MSTRPDYDVAQHLIDNISITGLSLIEGENVFYGPVRQPDDTVDQMAIFIIPTGGPAPEALHSCTSSLWDSDLQIWVRGKRKRGYQEVLELAREIRDVLQSDGSPTISGYIDVQMLGSEPLYRGEDTEGRPQFVLNVELSFDE